MAVEITGKFKPKNNGSFSLIDAEDVEMPDGTRLSEFSGSAGQAGLTPYIGANGNWWIGDTDTGTKAQGEKGEKGDQGIQGIQGEKGAKGDTGATGAKGDKGDTGQAGANGSPGKDGSPGADGKDGVSPTVSITAITGGNRVSITDATGTKTFDVMDGEDGTGGSITVDDELSTTSTNPVQNKVITTQINQAMTALQNVVLPRLTPTVSSTDNGKVLTVDGGAWVAKESTGGGGTGSAEVPVFNLQDLGMSGVPATGGTAMGAADTTAICAALDKGPVIFVIPFVASGFTIPVPFTMNGVCLAGDYQCISIVDYGGMSTLTVEFSTAGYKVNLKPLADDINALIDAKVGVIENGTY